MNVQTKLPRAWEVYETGREEGLHIGAQWFISQNGQTLIDAALGESRPGVDMKPETVMPWFSSGKPVAAVAIAMLSDAGLLDIDAPVAEVIPEFATGGKQRVTTRHLLTHTGGFPKMQSNWMGLSWDDAIAHVCDLPLENDWEPGERAGYHVASSWFILGELVGRLSGDHFSQFVRERIFLPLGMMDAWVGMPGLQFHAYGDRLAVMQNTALQPPRPHPISSEAGCVACAPGGNAHGRMRDLARFYETLRNGGELDGVRILKEATVREWTAPQRVGRFDETFQHKIDWGLGVIINSRQYGPLTLPYGYGNHASPRSYGHSGVQSSTGFVDPDRGLVVALVFNGMPGELKHNRRMRRLTTALYEDLGLTDSA